MSKAIHEALSEQGHAFIAYGSNAVRLSLKQWLVVLLIVAPLFVLTPVMWRRAEKVDASGDFRTNYHLSSDYWLYESAAIRAAERYDAVVLGDSVIWGQYVTPRQTLTHYLNEASGRERFGNLGLDGSHPLALSGLIEHYGSAIAGKNVVLLCNPLWMSSPKHDLQTSEEFRFNHPRLVPQFRPKIPCYKEELSPRIGIVVERNVHFNAWTAHLQHAYFEHNDIPAWTLAHPYTSPLSAITFAPMPDDGKLRHEPLAWTEQGIKPQNFPFVKLNESLQWQAFLRAVEILQSRGNKVVVVINPLNEHMLTEASRKLYAELRGGIESELKAKKIDAIAPALLPSKEYADASHPLSEGYRRIAGELFEKLKALGF